MLTFAIDGNNIQGTNFMKLLSREKLLSTEKSSLTETVYQPNYYAMYIVCDWFPANFGSAEKFDSSFKIGPRFLINVVHVK